MQRAACDETDRPYGPSDAVFGEAGRTHLRTALSQVIGTQKAVAKKIRCLCSAVRLPHHEGILQSRRSAPEHEGDGVARMRRKIEVPWRRQVQRQLAEAEPVGRGHTQSESDAILIRSNFVLPRKRRDFRAQHHANGLPRLEAGPTRR